MDTWTQTDIRGNTGIVNGDFSANGLLGTGWCFGNQACQEKRGAAASAKAQDEELTKTIIQKLSEKQASPTPQNGLPLGVKILLGVVGVGLLATGVYFLTKKRA